MRSLLLGLALVLVACSHQPISKVVDSNLATQVDCKQVYQHILTLTVIDFVDPNFTFSAEEELMAEFAVDQINQDNGMKGRFLRACYGQMTMSQVECALSVNHTTNITACVHLTRK